MSGFIDFLSSCLLCIFAPWYFIDMRTFSDTICAPATSVGSGAISVIRLSGPDSLSITDSIVSFRKGCASESPGYTLKYGEIPGVDQVIVSIYRAPHSYTGEDSVELSCHASEYIVSRIIALLCDAGCRVANPGEFSQRAFVNGKMDLAQVEAVADVIAASSESQHRVAMNQLRGGYSAELAKIRSKLVELSALLELELDFSEEEVEFADRSRLAGLIDEAAGRCRSLADSFSTGNAIRNGVPVAIVGAPNSGKSTLLNALLNDDRAIVSDVPGTTRDTVEETCVYGGILFRFIDTAGIRETDDEVERMGIKRAFDKVAGARVILGMVDVTDSWNAAGSFVGDRASNCPECRSENGYGDSKDDSKCISAGKSGSLQGISESAPGCGCGNFEGLKKCAEEGCKAEGRSGSVSDFSEAERSVKEQIGKLVGMVDGRKQSLVILLNKCDALGKCGVEIFDSQSPDDDGPADGVAGQAYGFPVLRISAKYGDGLDKVRELLVSSVGDLSQESVLVTNARHARALGAAASELERVRDGITSLPPDLLAEDLRSAISSLGEITGEITTDEVLGEIFSRFCIGK